MQDANGQRARPIRGQRLLDALEAVPKTSYAGAVWRSVAKGRDPLTCWRSGGRWDDKTIDVLYTSESMETALAERRFHLFQGQPIPPSKIQYELFELRVSLEQVMRFPSLDALKAVGMDVAGYGLAAYFEKEREYPRSQEVAEACAFLGAQGVVAPSARELKSNNLVIFCEQTGLIEKAVTKNHGVIAFK